MNDGPHVSVVTPLHNAESYLGECIESVLNQTYRNWSYVIVNNCSDDGSLEIAERYARKDSRISVINNASFVGIVENFNIAVSKTAPESGYCKVVAADDWLFPECLEKMVSLGERHPTVGVVGAYQLSGSGAAWSVRCDQLPYPSPVVSGREICRAHLLGGFYVFGSPSSVMYRADLVRSRSPFYPHLMPHADTSVCYECLRVSDFGFVHQVLSYERIHDQSASAECRRIRTAESIILRNLIAYGPDFLTEQEQAERLGQALDDYYRSLAIGFFNGRGREFWRFHDQDLRDLGYRCFGGRLAAALGLKFLDLALNPKQTLEKLLSRHSRPTAESHGEPLRISTMKGGAIDARH